MSQEALLQRGLIPKIPESIDSSMLKDFVDCPSKFYLRHVLGLKKKGIKIFDEQRYGFGTAWHKMLEVYYTTRTNENEQAAKVAALSTLQNWPKSLRPEVDKKKRSKERIIKMFFEYLETWAEQDKNYEFIRQEQFFDVLIDGYLRWMGRIDGIRYNIKRKKKLVWDYKTATTMGGHYFDGHEIGFQFPGYVISASEMDTEYIDEITVDVLYVLVASHQFFRRNFHYSSARLEEWKRNVIMWLDQIRELLEKHLYEPEMWRKNWNECTRYGLCQFFDIHSLAPTGNTRLNVLENDYIVDRWDPSGSTDDETDAT